jgi:uncharacterized RDD family membrane protein YckC
LTDLGGQPETVPGYAVDIEAAAYRPPTPTYRYDKSQLAHWGVRVAAALIDSAAVGWPVAIPYEAMSEGHRRTVMIANGLIVTLVLTVLVTVWEGRTGRSPAKALLRLRVVDRDGGQPLGFWRALGRRAAHLLDQLTCYLGYLWPLWDDQRQTFSDKVARSVVVAKEN